MAEDHSPIVIEAVRKRLSVLEAEKFDVAGRLEEIDSDIDMLRRWLADMQRASHSDFDGDEEPEKGASGQFQGMSVREAMHALARNNSRVLVMKDAVRRLVKEGFYPNNNKAMAPMYARLSRGVEKGEWEKRRPGVYVQLKDPYVEEKTSDGMPSMAEQHRLMSKVP